MFKHQGALKKKTPALPKISSSTLALGREALWAGVLVELEGLLVQAS